MITTMLQMYSKIRSLVDPGAPSVRLKRKATSTHTGARKRCRRAT